MGKAAKAGILTLIIILIIIGLAWVGYSSVVDHTNDMIKKGCVPKAFDRNGTPTIWSCPPGVN